MRKHVFVWMIIALLLAGTGTIPVSATQLGDGLKEPEVCDIAEDEIGPVQDNPDREMGTESGSSEFADWDKYANDYYYNQLSSQLQRVWDELDVICESYKNGEKDVSKYYTSQETGKVTGYLEWVTFSDPLTADELRKFWEIYVYSNPQYYFLDNSYMRSSGGTNANGENTYKKLALSVYQAFWDGEYRSDETEKVRQQLDAWQQQIDACPTDAQKVKVIQDLICAKVTYNKKAANNEVDENISFSQSPYSVICGEAAVCAGYADTFYMLCNASGIDAISVTSPGHQWNKARINSAWYNFDVTWDDTYTESKGCSVYCYHGRSDAMYDTDLGYKNSANIENHQEEAFWEAYIPACNLDTNPTGNCKEPGTFAAEIGQVAAPVIMITCENDILKASISCDTPGATVYYTTDGTGPSVTGAKSVKYTEAFAVDENTSIKAVAVKDAYTDSVIAEKVVELKQYAITYQLDGGINAQGNPETYDVRDEIVFQAPSKQGYVFAGWYADQQRTAEVTGIAPGNVGERTFYAKWEPAIYKIAFDGNGATAGVMTIQEQCRYDESVTLSGNRYTRIGYAFSGWNTKADGSGESYEDMASVKNLAAEDGATVTVYAQWAPNLYSVYFDGNEATGGATASLTACSYDSAYALTANSFVKTGYTFTGWNTKADGSGDSYSDEETVTALVPEGSVTLYAQWTANVYKVVFEGNGATGGATAAMTDINRGEFYELPANGYVRTGYVFAGWNTMADGSGDSYTDGAQIYNLETGNTDEISLYARWSPIVYKVTFDGNGAMGGVTAPLGACNYDSAYALTANSFVRNGYIFAGWNTKADGSGTAYTNNAKVKNLTSQSGATVTLYARWRPIAYKVAFDGNGATGGATASLTACNYDSAYALTANSFVKTGYTFTGWNTKADGSGTAYTNNAKVKNLTSQSGATVTLYARWRANSYTIKFDGNKAEKGSMKSMPALLYGKSYALSKNKYKRTGYRFDGWNTAKNGKGISFKNKAAIQNLSAQDGAVVTLYARWKANQYKVKFHGNGATSGSVKTMKNCSYGKKFRLSANKFKKEGYKFVGWNTKRNGKGKMYANKAKVKNLTSKNGKTVTLYAQWKKIKK